MKYSKANLQVGKVCSGDKKDPALHQIFFEDDGTTVASDGKVLMAVAPVRDVPKSFPAFPTECEIPTGGVGVPPDIVEGVLRNIPKGNLGIELGFAALTGCADPGDPDAQNHAVAFTTSDLRQNKTIEGQQRRQRFPEWKQILRDSDEKSKKTLRVCIDRRNLQRLLQAMELACVDPDHSAFIEISEDSNKGIIIRGANVETGQHAIGYIMPTDTGDKWLPVDAWEKGIMGRSAKKAKRVEKEGEQ